MFKLMFADISNHVFVSLYELLPLLTELVVCVCVCVKTLLCVASSL